MVSADSDGGKLPSSSMLLKFSSATWLLDMFKLFMEHVTRLHEHGSSRLALQFVHRLPCVAS
jgi:hypothetical protein